MNVVTKVVRVSWRMDRFHAARLRMLDRGMFKWASFLRTVARRSIRKRKKPSAAGSPPSTQTRRLRNAILFHVYRGEGKAIIGPTANIVGPSGAAHEFGGTYKGDKFDRRPFMGPALDVTRPQAAGFFAGEFK